MATLKANPLIAPIWPAELSYASPEIRTLPATDGFIESALRAGGSRLCEPPCESLPRIARAHTHYALRQGPQSHQLVVQLGDICRGENIRYKEMNFYGQRSVYEPNAEPMVTLLVLAERSEAPGSWMELTRKLYNHLRARGIQGVPVETMDPRFMQRPKIHPCLPTDAIFPVWTHVATDIFRGIDRTGVFSIGCFRIGNSYNRMECQPTVLLGVDRKVKREWKPLKEAIVAILDRNNLNSVAVTICKDNKITRDGGPGDDDIGARVKDCRRDPVLGTSLSPRSLRTARGTLGGWVELLNPQKGIWVPFAIACLHCCFPSEDGLSKVDLQVLSDWKKDGVYPQDENKGRLLAIVSPSYKDMNRAIKSLKAGIEELNSDTKYRQVKDLKDRDEFVMPYQERIWANVSKDIRAHEMEHQEMKDLLNSNEHWLGIVFAASGLREVQSTTDPQQLSIRDWALLPSSETNRTLMQLQAFDFDLPEMDQRLFKIGRVTNCTSGTYGVLKSCNIVRRTVNGAVIHIPTFEHVISHPGHRVVEEGDSRSLVFSANGVVLGMISSGNGSNDLGYFTATKDLLTDIKNITRAKDVRLRYLE
ncbi:uncharacterized protein BDV17DRAFT_300296 [Aspergillus undulatus]|uniref:uncharacterized protein n=1 Tax=Aspergillus undulatus TaxID=1810928 RepID=UPI003CCCD30C